MSPIKTSRKRYGLIFLYLFLLTLFQVIIQFCFFYIINEGKNVDPPTKFLADLVVMELPLFIFFLYLFNKNLSFMKAKYLFVLNLITAIFLMLNSWAIQSMFAWSLMFWLIYFIGSRLTTTQRYYLAFFAIMPATTLWEIPVLITNGYTTTATSLFLNLTTPTIISTKILCLPFLALVLYDLKWKLNKTIISYTLLYGIFFLYTLVFPFNGSGWIITFLERLPTVLFLTLFIFSGLRKC